MAKSENLIRMMMDDIYPVDVIRITMLGFVIKFVANIEYDQYKTG